MTREEFEFLYDKAKMGHPDAIEIFLEAAMQLTDQMAAEKNVKNNIRISEKLREERSAYILKAVTNRVTYKTLDDFLEAMDRYLKQERVKAILEVPKRR